MNLIQSIPTVCIINLSYLTKDIVSVNKIQQKIRLKSENLVSTPTFVVDKFSVLLERRFVFNKYLVAFMGFVLNNGWCSFRSIPWRIPLEFTTRSVNCFVLYYTIVLICTTLDPYLST